MKRIAGYLLDPGLLALWVLAQGVVVWFLIGPGGAAPSWAIQACLDVAIVALSWRLARLAVRRPTRRFWRALAFAGLSCTVGDTYQTVVTIVDPSAPVSLVQTALVVTGMTTVAVTMLFHPMGSAGRQRLRLWLDAATVLTAVAVFLWYFSIGAHLDSVRPADRYAAAASSAVMLVIVFGALKLILSGTAPFSKTAGLAGSIGVAGTAIGTSVGIILTGGTDPGVMTVASLLPCILTVASLRMQTLQELRSRRNGPRPERAQRFSRMPYVAVLGTQVLLVVALLHAGQDARVWGVTVGVVVITALVLGRQVAAFNDNDRLMVELRNQKEWYSSLVRHSSDITVVVDADHTVRYVSPAAGRVLGVDPTSVTTAIFHDHIHPDDRSVFADLHQRLTATAQDAAQLRLRHSDGTYRWIDIIGTRLLDHPSVRGIVYNARDVTEARALQDELRHRADHDTLTGLPNRAFLDERLAAAGPGPVSVLLIDLDGFKQVNDVHGHHAGDHLLVTLAGRLAAALVPGETAARLGGDEFAVLLPGTSQVAAQALADRISAAFTEPVLYADATLRVGASIGVATGPASEALIRSADAAMYARKSSRAGLSSAP